MADSGFSTFNVEGWDPSDVPVKMHRDEFLERGERAFPYEVEGGTALLAQRVLRALQIHVTEGEWEDIRSSVPRDLASVLP